jgi:hypothetical protein
MIINASSYAMVSPTILLLMLLSNSRSPFLTSCQGFHAAKWGSCQWKFFTPNSLKVLPSDFTTPTTSTLLLGLWGGGSEIKHDDVVLKTFDISDNNNKNNDNTLAFDSLSDYIQNKWAPLFVTGNIPLTTPVVLESVVSTTTKEEEDAVEAVNGVRLLFQKVDRGYKSKEEEENEEESSENSKENNDQNAREMSQGGVEILVEKLKGSGQLRVRARRCAIDEDTLIKEMSEETILRELRTAIEVWKKDTI